MRTPNGSSKPTTPRAALCRGFATRRGLYESLKDYNENASLWVAWFEGEKPADLAAFIQQEIEKAEASVEE